MAKTVSPIFKFQGTIEDLTFVNSRRYKPHVRARKNSKTPFVMTAALAESKAKLQQCNQYAKPIFQALRAESHDGGLWSRLVSQLFAELKAGRPLGLECLQGFECNLQHPMEDVITKGYDLSATVSQNQLSIYVQLHAHPAVADALPRTGYQLRFVAIIPDAAKGTVQKLEVLGPLTKYNDELTAHDLPITLPGNGAPCILLMGIVPHMQSEGAVRIMSDSGMKVVWVGRQATEERQATSCELRAAEERQASSHELRAPAKAGQVTSGREPEMTREKDSGNGVTVVMGLGADAAEKIAAGPLVGGEVISVSLHSDPENCYALRSKLTWPHPMQMRPKKLQQHGQLRTEDKDQCLVSPLAPAKYIWDDSVRIISWSKEKGPEPLVIDTAGDRGKGLLRS